MATMDEIMTMNLLECVHITISQSFNK